MSAYLQQCRKIPSMPHQPQRAGIERKQMRTRSDKNRPLFIRRNWGYFLTGERLTTLKKVLI